MNAIKKILNALSVTGSVITYIYCIMNLLVIIISLLFSSDDLLFLTSPIFLIDGYTWHVYGIVSLFTFILKLSSLSHNEQNLSLKKATILHLIAMIISFVCIIFIFFNFFI